MRFGLCFVIDTGIVIPSITVPLRKHLLGLAEGHGLSGERQIEIMGRAATEMILQFIDGEHRLVSLTMHNRKFFNSCMFDYFKKMYILTM